MTSAIRSSLRVTVRLFSAAIFLVMANDVGIFAAEKTTVPSKISRVTVYSDRAVVTRELSFKVAKGRSLIVLEGLIPNLDQRTLKFLPVRPRKGLKIVDLSSEVYPLLAPNRADLADLLKRSKKISAKVSHIEDQIVAFHERTRVLAEYRKLTSSVMKEGMLSSQPKLEQWLKASQFISAQALASTTGIRDLEQKKFDLNTSLKDLKAQMNGIRTPRAGQACRVQVALESRGEKVQAFRLSYLVRGGISWGPKYDIRLDRSTSRIEMTRIGVLSQQTGEDWSQAIISFSTRKAARGLRPPVFEPVLLGALKRPNRVSTLTSRHVTEDAALRKPEATSGGGMSKVGPLVPPSMGQAPRVAPAAGNQVPRLRAGGEVVEFVSSEQINVRSDGKPVMVPLGSWKVRCKWELECIPKLLGSVYIRGDFLNPTGALMLPGPGECYVDGEYIGKIRVPVSPVGSRVQVSFGAVEGLSVTRKSEPLKGKRKGGYHYVYKIELANSTQKPVLVTVLEGIPVSSVKAVTVKLDKTTTPCQQLSGGRLRWKVKLAPGERKELRLAYTVDISKDYRY
jgi:uncharacterized protein (TIGR02231 family)